MRWWPLAWRGGRADATRWVALDVESSGLDPRADRLLAVAAIALHVDWNGRRLALRPGDSFEVVLRQEAPPADRDNILLHGIGVGEQRAGLAPAEALHALARFAEDAPLLAFHAAFDQTMVTRAMRESGLAPLSNDWLDIEHLCAAAYPQVKARSLDEWMDHFGIDCAVRHQAAADTLAECELMLRIWPVVARECTSWQGLRRMADSHRWLRGG